MFHTKIIENNKISNGDIFRTMKENDSISAPLISHDVPVHSIRNERSNSETGQKEYLVKFRPIKVSISKVKQQNLS